MGDDIKKIIQDTAKKTAKEVTQELGVLIEDVQSDVKHIVEAVDIHTRQLERLAPIEESLGKIDDRLATVETILESVNLPVLKQKVASLEKRIEELEKAR